MYKVATNTPKELKLASNNCYDNVSLPCGQIYTVYKISPKIHVILTKDNLKFLFIPKHFEIICNNHKFYLTWFLLSDKMDKNA